MAAGARTRQPYPMGRERLAICAGNAVQSFENFGRHDFFCFSVSGSGTGEVEHGDLCRQGMGFLETPIKGPCIYFFDADSVHIADLALHKPRPLKH